MHARTINVRKALIVAAVASMLLVGAGVAYATGADDDSSGQAGGKDLEKAKSVALDHTNGGTVTETEVGDEEGYYEVEVTKGDGSQVDVHLGKDFDVLGTQDDNENPDDKDGPEDNED